MKHQNALLEVCAPPKTKKQPHMAEWKKPPSAEPNRLPQK